MIEIKKKLKIINFIAIIAVFLTIISDFVLLGKPTDTYTFLKFNTETMAKLSIQRIITGTFLGVIVLPFQLGGVINLYCGLKPAGRIRSLIVLITTGHALILAVGFHIAYAYIGSAWRLQPITELMQNFDLIWKITLVIMSLDLLMSCICYISLILSNNTLYPKWMVYFNPIFILIFMFIVILPLPAPLGGFIAPAYLNLSTLVFYILTILFQKAENVGDF